MWTRNFLIIRVAMRGAVQGQAHEDDGLSCAILECRFRELQLGASYVKDEVFSLICGREGDCDPGPRDWEIPLLVVHTLLFHCNKRVRFGLCEIYISHTGRSQNAEYTMRSVSGEVRWRESSPLAVVCWLGPEMW